MGVSRRNPHNSSPGGSRSKVGKWFWLAGVKEEVEGEHTGLSLDTEKWHVSVLPFSTQDSPPTP